VLTERQPHLDLVGVEIARRDTTRFGDRRGRLHVERRIGGFAGSPR
jgi:hypothetical protein